MKTPLPFAVTPQPSETTCGPSCLHAVYRYFEDEVPLDTLLGEVDELPEKGTLAVLLAIHAIRRGYDAQIYTCNLQMFDPSWFPVDRSRLIDKLERQLQAKGGAKLELATRAYQTFLTLGGRLDMPDFTPELIAEVLTQGLPIIAALSATWLYRCPRDRPSDMKPDDITGEPCGHFVVIHGYNPQTRRATLADPYINRPYPGSHAYDVDIDRLVGAILLGIVTYDAKLLVLRPREPWKPSPC